MDPFLSLLLTLVILEGIFVQDSAFAGPSERPNGLIPDTREEIATEFRFFAPGSGSVPVIIKNTKFSDWDIEGSGFKPDAKTKIITHGFMGGNAPWPLRLKDALIQKENANVFIVDWTSGHGPIYKRAVANIRVVGAEVGLFIQRLKKATNLDLQKIHLIGHSLGSHASGYAGKWVKDRDPNNMVGRITGLDPAGPYFNDVFPVVRLDAGDAQFVDVIHTHCAGHRFSGFGLFEPIGHFDFYPNGGEEQPGCIKVAEASANILSGAAKYASPISYIVQWVTGKLSESESKNINDLSCSHSRAHDFFIASIEEGNCQFKALQCFSWERYLAKKCGTCQDHTCVAMGYYADEYKQYAKNNVSKKFYLKTTADYPYCVDKES